MFTFCSLCLLFRCTVLRAARHVVWPATRLPDLCVIHEGHPRLHGGSQASGQSLRLVSQPYTAHSWRRVAAGESTFPDDVRSFLCQTELVAWFTSDWAGTGVIFHIFHYTACSHCHWFCIYFHQKYKLKTISIAYCSVCNEKKTNKNPGE